MRWFSRSELLLGEAALERLRQSRVAVFGMGGVGSFVVEALARAGVGHLRLVDHDVVSGSNLNRQIFALRSTIGLPKVEVAEARVLDINPACQVEDRRVYSLEPAKPAPPPNPLDIVPHEGPGRPRRPLGTISYRPAVLGLELAEEVLRYLLAKSSSPA